MIHLDSRRTWLLCTAALLVAWAAFLVLQPGQPYDEAEHAHAAWLMARLGQRPVLDFFQHHQRLLWDLLRPAYLFVDGPEILWWGRALVVLCVAPFAWLLLRLGGRSALLAIALFALFGVEFPDFLTLRPESPALALFALALLSWRRRTTAFALLAGVLYGAALFSSLRFVLLAPAFLLFAEPWRPSPRHVLAAVVGASLVWALYPPLAGEPSAVLLFDLRFSRYLQGVGVGSENVWPALRTWSLATLALAVLVWRSPVEARRRGVLLLVTGAVLFLGCRIVAGRYTYVQAFIPAFVWIALAAARLARDVEWGGESEQTRWANVAALAGAGWLVWSTALYVSAGDDLAAQVRLRRDILGQLQPGDTILTRPHLHPITARDGSFYGTPLVDSPDRLCVAVRGFAGPVPLPTCDYASELLAHPPKLLDEGLLEVVPADRRDDLQALIARSYARVPVMLNPAPWKRVLWRRKD